jgi:hypothetical protein
MLALTMTSIVAAAADDSKDPPHYRAKQILGSTVNIDDDSSVGTVDDIVFDVDGNVDYLIVAQDGKLVTVPWDAVQFNAERRRAAVNIAPDKYKGIPTYTADQYPVFNPSYRTEVYRYWGLTPGRERRLIRRGLVR